MDVRINYIKAGRDVDLVDVYLVMVSILETGGIGLHYTFPINMSSRSVQLFVYIH